MLWDESCLPSGKSGFWPILVSSLPTAPILAEFAHRIGERLGTVLIALRHKVLALLEGGPGVFAQSR